MVLPPSINASTSLNEANDLLRSICGIHNFFTTEDELRGGLDHKTEDRSAYGDFQTNAQLSLQTVQQLNIDEPEVLIEPTCGKGNFIIAALKTFKSLKTIYGIEIYKSYVLECKLAILDFFLNNNIAYKPDIFIIEANVFEFDFSAIKHNNILIIGNPPWVTNAALNGNNLPHKSNFKKLKGIDAITGKSNFDIAESITNLLLKTFQHCNGHVCLLVKNTVIKNIVFDQKKNNYKISQMQKLCIDSKKEFGAAVNAASFTCKLNSEPSFQCTGNDKNFGWINDKFVADTNRYDRYKHIDGISTYEWRQGIKHDCASAMELEISAAAELENDLVYAILKGSDLHKQNTIPHKFTIVTQQKPGQDTSSIQSAFPKTFAYLDRYRKLFEQRRSNIYKNKPPFSIFGIGEYSFKPYKVAIAGLYKDLKFSLVRPHNGKPVMLDDTCYFIGFDELSEAKLICELLNSEPVIEFLRSICFTDSKRVITKEALMRIDLRALQQAKAY